MIESRQFVNYLECIVRMISVPVAISHHHYTLLVVPVSIPSHPIHDNFNDKKYRQMFGGHLGSDLLHFPSTHWFNESPTIKWFSLHLYSIWRKLSTISSMAICFDVPCNWIKPFGGICVIWHLSSAPKKYETHNQIHKQQQIDFISKRFYKLN